MKCKNMLAFILGFYGSNAWVICMFTYYISYTFTIDIYTVIFANVISNTCKKCVKYITYLLRYVQ